MEQKKTDEMLWEEALKIVSEDVAKGTVSAENMTETVKMVYSSLKEERDGHKVEEKSEMGEIAGGFVEQEEETIGSGIVAEPEPEIAKEEEKEDDFIIRFSKPYRFEGKTYAGVDLSGLKNLKAKDLWKVNRNYRNAGNVSVLPEIDAEYTARVAAKASNLPIEFFENMPLNEATKIKAKVSGFFMEKE